MKPRIRYMADVVVCSLLFSGLFIFLLLIEIRLAMTAVLIFLLALTRKIVKFGKLQQEKDRTIEELNKSIKEMKIDLHSRNGYVKVKK